MKQDNGNKKSRKIVFILILFLLVFLVITLVTYSYYRNNLTSQKLKSEVLKSLEKNELSFFLEHDLYQAISKKMEENSYEFSAAVQLSTSMENNMFSNLDLSKFGLTYSGTKDREHQKSYHKIETQYAGNDLLMFDFITNPKQFAIKSDEIVNRYVGLNLANMQNTVNQLYKTQVDLSDFKKVKNFMIDREKIDISSLSNSQIQKTYAELIQKEILPENINKKENVIVTMNAEQIPTTEYTISFTKEQVGHLLEKIGKTLEKDKEIFTSLVVSEVEEIGNGGILEYTDNDNTVEISGQENNFQTSLEIWGENPTNEIQTLNTVPANTTIENTTIPQNNTITNQVSNETRNETTNQIMNQVANQMSNETATNQVTNEIIPTPVNENTVPTENTTTTEQNQTPEEPSQAQNEQGENQAQQNPPEEIIEEEDNVRTQGFIGVNEDRENELPEDVFIIGENLEETLKNLTYWIEKIDWKTYLLTGAKANCTPEELKEKWQSILKERIKQNHSLIAKVYVSEEKAIKLTLEVPETLEKFDVEIFSVNSNEKYLKLSFLVGEENKANGSIFNLYVKKSDSVNKVQIGINQINKNKISQKTNLDIQTKGTINAKKYTTDMEISYSNAEGEFKTNLNHSLNFEVTPEIEDLNEENCLFLDLLSNEELEIIADAISQKTWEVLSEKNRNLNIIDLNNSNLIVQQTEQNQSSEEETSAKEQAKQALIETIRGKMQEYLNQGKELKIEDLENLEIPNYEVNLSISSNLAIITVGGYHFKLDSDFNLSDS